MKNLNLLSLVVLLVATGPAMADTADPMLNPAIEDRFKSLTEELRCVKCQNQTIYDSKAGVAEDLKRQIRTQIQEGKSDQEIIDYLVARYGDFVRYRPSFDARTALLWTGPFLLLLVGAAVMIAQIRKRRTLVADSADLSEDDHKRAQMLLGGNSGETKS